MQKVITINLNGNAYQLDERAYDLLRAYLDRAGVQLANNPDRDEIMADLEQAIAEKCQKVLGANKTVVTTAEMERIVDEMGPVEGDNAQPAEGAPDAGGSAPRPAAAGAPPRRFYRIREGAMWEGVCTGLAAFCGIDVTIVRIVFSVLTLVSFGTGILGYMLLAWIVPEARTSDERAAAHGQSFNAQAIVDQVKQYTTGFTERDDWKQWTWHWRQQQRQWRRHHRAWQRQWRGRMASTPPWTWSGPAPHTTDEPPAWTAFLMPVFSFVSLLLFVGLLAAIASLVDTGALLGWPLPESIPLWGGVVMLVILFQVVTGPLRLARQASSYAWGGRHAWFAAWDSLVGLSMAALVIWLVSRHMPPVHNLRELMANLPAAFRALTADFKMWVDQIFASV